MDNSARDKAMREKVTMKEVTIKVGVDAYHDYRQGPNDKSDPFMIRRGTPPPPACGAGKGFKGVK